MKINLAVIFGCRSVEHEVSIISAVQAMASINKEKYEVIPVYVAKNGIMYTGDALTKIDTYKSSPEDIYKVSEPVFLMRSGNEVVMRYLNKGLFSKKADVRIDVAFPIVHGTNCEDGTIAGLLEFLNLPYVGCDIISAAVGMDKFIFKNVLKEANLPVLPCVCFTKSEYIDKGEEIRGEISQKLTFPVIVKPVNLGSSVGIKKIKSTDELNGGIEYALRFADRVLVEHAIEHIREINCSVLGDREDCAPSVCEEPFMGDEILSYDDKYKGNSGSKGMASLGRKIPADLSEEKAKEIQDLSVKIFKAIGASGVVRIDFILDSADNDKVYANEINTIPGSLAFYLWEASGTKYPRLIEKLISLAFKRQRDRDKLAFSIDTDILTGVNLGTKGTKGGKF